MQDDELRYALAMIRGLAAELRHAVQSNLTILSLLERRPSMPDPHLVRVVVDYLLAQLENQ